MTMQATPPRPADAARPAAVARSGLTIDRVTCRYEGSRRPALNELSVEVQHGETLAVLGPSGCGKSTLLRAVAGIEPISGGGIRLGDRELSRSGFTLDADRRDVGMVFQNYALWPHLRVYDIIGYGLAHGRHRTSRARREARVAELVAMLQLEGLEQRRPAELSGGQQQRVAIARALATEPSVLLFDEPLSNLDVQLRTTMLPELASLLRRLDTTAVYVTHDVSEALALADSVLVLDSGVAVQHASPREISELPATPWVAMMAGYRTRIAPDSASQDAGRARIRVDGFELEGRASGDRDAALAAYIHPDSVRMTMCDAATSDESRIAGRVLGSTFEGRGYRLRVQLPGNGEVAVRSTEWVRDGQTVSLAVDPTGVVVFGARDRAAS
ncbi:ABC transporter ATP-binding protein [Microbacterium halotolerans]|uniref:ABC transporter ATP-binding protein n=1 Tax=Microbacterium halotolerans TaxID=246613 RepID=UPI000E6AB93A|nr:ABC transporter ATP-binding protein [Microbacterium halotolerans]